MKKILLIIVVILVLGSCRSSRYNMPNDTYFHNGKEKKWYSKEPKRGIIKTVHHPRWANNKR